MIATVADRGGLLSVVLSQEDEGDEGEELDIETEETEEEAPNPILPEPKEIAWGFGSFLVLLVLMRYIAFPGVKRGMDARAAGIRSDIEAAESAKAEAEAMQVEYRTQLGESRAEASRIVDEVRLELAADRAEQLAQLNAELADLRGAAAQELEASKTRAVADLETAVTGIAIGAAERVVQRPIDRQANEPLVRSYLQQARVDS